MCDLGCRGCYAPNLISTRSTTELVDARPELFLSEDKLQQALDKIACQRAGFSFSAAVRGGEPSLHPNLAQLFRRLTTVAHPVYLETHGRWVGVRDTEVLRVCSRLGIVLKVSFDSMHCISSQELLRICDAADAQCVHYLVAITEPSEHDFRETRDKCRWIPDERIVVQRKATVSAQLIQPKLGVLTPNGNLAAGLSVRQEFVFPLAELLT